MQSRFERRQHVLHDLFENYAKHSSDINLSEAEAETFSDFMRLDQDVRVPFLLALRSPVISVLQAISVSTDVNLFACANGEKFLVPPIQQAIRSLGGPYCGKGGDLLVWPFGTLGIKESESTKLFIRKFFSTLRANEDVVDCARHVPAVNDVHIFIFKRHIARLMLEKYLSTNIITGDVNWPRYFGNMFGCLESLSSIGIHDALLADPKRIRGSDFWLRLVNAIGNHDQVMGASVIERTFLKPPHDLQERVSKATDWEEVALTPPVCITAALFQLLLDDVNTKLAKFAEHGAEMMHVLRFAVEVCIVVCLCDRTSLLVRAHARASLLGREYLLFFSFFSVSRRTRFLSACNPRPPDPTVHVSFRLCLAHSHYNCQASAAVASV